MEDVNNSGQTGADVIGGSADHNNHSEPDLNLQQTSNNYGEYESCHPPFYNLMLSGDVHSAPLQYNAGWIGSSEELGAALMTNTGMLPTTVHPPPPNAIDAHHNSQIAPKEGSGRGWTAELDRLLLDRRREGKAYSLIVEEMKTTKGVITTSNRLVKRHQRLQLQNLDPVAEAVKNAMPEIMASIKVSIDKMGLESILEDKYMLDQVMQELPSALPRFVQNRVTNKRKSLRNTSLERE